MIPEGMCDVLPPEALRLRAVEDLLPTRFAALVDRLRGALEAT